jgi:hypothetical protein
MGQIRVERRSWVLLATSTGVLPAPDRPALEQALAEGRFRQSDDTDGR